MHAIVPVLSLGLAWWLLAAAVPTPILYATLAYGLAHLGLISYRRYRKASARASNASALAWLAVGADTLFAALLILQAGPIGGAIYPLYLLLLMRGLSSYRRLPAATLVAFLFGPSYLFAQQLLRSGAPASSPGLLVGWELLLGSLAIGTIAIWSGATQQRMNMALRQELRAERLGREARIGDLERSANDLRGRMRQLHALEEGLRVITSTLSLDEVLDQIVDSTVQMLGPARVQGMVLSLQREDGFEHQLFMLEERNGVAWATSLTRRAVQQQAPLIIGDAALDDGLAGTIAEGLSSALCVPLFVGEGPAQGALTVVSATPSAFSSSDARHLNALAIQAGIAIHNAEMHSRLSQQQQLLEAVVRDINDGLVVVDARSQIVLANPIGRALLDQTIEDQPIQAQLLALAASIRAEGKATVMTDLQLTPEHGDDAERIYQAFGSQVRYDDSEQPLIAIVLRDITEQKAEERSRSEFISMVSHELRNPLNSLNGFIKVVLRGQAGALTPLQHEFLAIADGQVEQLKSRIAELLEYNRVEAGRLVLDPQWNDLALLVTGTTTRLTLQAEQNGLTLVNEVDSLLPECQFDSERIGQVLNNLIENAIKATPPGGTITLRSELYEDEVWIRVSDTGVGIPVEDQGKIFQRFYRAHDRSSSTGNHLGLGLAICQQIIAGHHGRLWVESEEGQGSCFTFALPFTHQEALVNQNDN
ncbi:MAG: GAF domain-containing protein [Kouleothrix sp.]|nr:GAF domain-containing protein [Kouleothrix sp.]